MAANYNKDTFLQAYEPTDTTIAFVNTQGVVTSLANICNITKILTEEKEVWVVLPDSKVTLGFSSVAEAQLALVVLQAALDALVVNCALSSGSGGVETIDVTYSELQSLGAQSALVPGNRYRLTDYQCIHTIRDENNNEVLNTTLAPEADGYPQVEVLILTATAVNQVDPTVVAEVFSLDIIHYSPSDQSGGATKGRVTYRKNTENGEEATYDFRGATAWRWESSPGSGVYVETELPIVPGCAWRAFKPFGNAITGTILGSNKDLSDVFPSNNYADADCMGITFENNASKNTAVQSQECTFKKGTTDSVLVSCYGTTVAEDANGLFATNYSTVEGEDLSYENKSNLTHKGAVVMSTFDVNAVDLPGSVFTNIPAGALITSVNFLVKETVVIGDDPATETVQVLVGGAPISFSTNLAAPPINTFTINQLNAITYAIAGFKITNSYQSTQTDLEITSTTNTFVSGVIRFLLTYQIL